MKKKQDEYDDDEAGKKINRNESQTKNEVKHGSANKC